MQCSYVANYYCSMLYDMFIFFNIQFIILWFESYPI